MGIIEDFYQCLRVPASCYISTVLSLPWYYPSGHYHYVPSSGLTAPHIICSVKKQRGRWEGGKRGWFPSLSLTHTHALLYSPLPSLLHAFFLVRLLLTFSCSVSHWIYLVVLLPGFIVFSLSSLSPLGQGASGDHPAGESQHQGGRGAKETCECCLIRDLRSYVTSDFSPLLLCSFDVLHLIISHYQRPALRPFSRTVLSSITPIIRARWSKPARPRRMGASSRATTWCTGYQRPPRKKKRSGSNPSSKTLHKYTYNNSSGSRLFPLFAEN